MFWMHNQNFIYTFDIVLNMLDNLYFISNVFESYCKQLSYRNHKVSLTIKKRHVISSWWQAIFTPVISTYIKREKSITQPATPYTWTYITGHLRIRKPIYRRDQFMLCVFLHIQELLSFIQRYPMLTPVGHYVGTYINLRRDLQSRTRIV